MSYKQISKHIWQIGIWMIVPMNVWLVQEKDGFTLIDTGISLMGNQIMNTKDIIGTGSLNRILLTHGHPDHVGSVQKILSRIDIPVYAHKKEIIYAEGQKPYPGRKKAEKTVQPALLKPLLEEGGNLMSMGDILPIHTPGHTPGHVAYFHKEDGVLLCGDLFTEKNGALNRPMPMFTSNMEQALESGREALRNSKPDIVCMSHGNPVKKSSWKKWLMKK